MPRVYSDGALHDFSDGANTDSFIRVLQSNLSTTLYVNRIFDPAGKPMRITINKLYFFPVSRKQAGRLTTGIYRKPTHTAQYLMYDSYHPPSVKQGIVKCLYECAKRLTTKPSALSKAEKHLSSVLVFNGCPLSFLQKTKYQCRAHDRVQEYYGFTLRERLIRTTSPLPTTRHTRCFQVGWLH